MPDLEAVVFDLDGTLAVVEEDFVDLWGRALDRADATFPVDRAALAGVDPATLPTAESRLEFHENVVRAAATDAGLDPAPATVTAVAEAYLAVHDPTDVSFRPGAEAALAAASERHDVGLVTNGGAGTQRGKLEALGVADAFDAAVFFDPTAGVEPKPHPAPMERVLAELGVDAERTLMVGDYLHSDVAGAHAVGMRSAWVPEGDPDPDPDPQPDHVLDSMDELPRVL